MRSQLDAIRPNDDLVFDDSTSKSEDALDDFNVSKIGVDISWPGRELVIFSNH